MEKCTGMGTYSAHSLKLNLRMKLSAILIMLSIFSVQANGYAQKTKISLDLNEVEIRQVFEEIESMTDFKFLYNNQKLDIKKLVSVKVTNQPVAKILDILFKGTPINYVILKKQIVIKVDASKAQTTRVVPDKSKVATVVQRQVQGVVLDANQEPLPGANIVEKGTTNGVTADFDGNFAINVANENAILVISYIGFATKEVSLKGQTSVSVQMEESASGLDEVVVVGYGTKLKGELTGSVSKVGDKIFEDRPVINTLDAMQGAMPGVTVTRSSGQPGREGYSINIRGASSIAGSSPLILIDGIPGDLNTINPNDIANVTVLKDAAASIYGARAADGVVMVTTKKGKNGRLSVNYSYNYGVNIPTYISEMTNTLQMAEMYDEGMRNIGQPGVTEEVFDKIRNNAAPEPGNGWMKYLENYPGFYGSHDWLKEIYGTGTQSMHNLSISGGEENHDYLISAGYKSNNGVITHGVSKSDLYNLRVNFGFNLFKNKLKVNLRTAFDNNVVKEPSALGSAIESAHLMWSYAPTYTPDGQFYWYQNYQNPIQLLEENGEKSSDLKKFQTNLKADLSITDDLKLVTQVGVNFELYDSNASNRTFDLINWDDETFGTRNNPNSATYFNSKNTYGSYTVYLDYNKTLFEKHRINLMGGVSHEQNEYESQSITGYNFKSNDIFTLNLADRTDVAFMDYTGSLTDWALNSYFGRFSYSYNRKFFVDVTTRIDGSSKFAASERWSALFPAVSASYNLGEENFIKNSNTINDLKLRASWGQSGNQNLSFGNYDYIPLITVSGNYPLGSPNVGLPGAVASIASESRTWETIETSNIGVDFALFDSRLAGSFDYFVKKNSDMLVNVTLPATLGGTAPTLNIGDLETKGWDFSIGWSDTKGDFKYSISANVSDAKNKLTKLEGNDSYAEGLVSTRQGYPINSYFGFESNGFIQNQQQLDEYKKLENVPQNIGIGDAMYNDLDGDGKITAFGNPEAGTTGDMKYLGNTNPRYTYSSNISLSYKNFDFSMLFQGVGKRVGIREGVPSMPLYYVWHPSISYFHGKTWTPERTDAEFPRIIPGGVGWDELRDWNYKYSDRVVNKLSYLRVKSLVLAFNLPESICESLRLESFRLYTSADDLFTFSKGTWGNSYDPESLFAGRNKTYQNYPFTKTISLGVDLKF
ncbi:TonB-dependent receptor [uncultured Zobellia sp.]|uniref:TonB-dependent receptor n=1 Tax=uncultured Zobellia sp. TaxID=255433 RepID=UPI002591399B|nr:TonB-dependent receptor [uncultured Zobellia sp.]